MFEYDVVEVAKGNPEKIADKLNKFGEDGWEVCAVYESNSHPRGAWLGIIIKRAIPVTRAVIHEELLREYEETR